MYIYFDDSIGGLDDSEIDSDRTENLSELEQRD
jgi:hypothetical protein